jgi:hypothetical protein
MSKRDHEARARAAFGEDLYIRLRIIACEAAVRRYANRDRAEAEAQQRDACAVADAIEKALGIVRNRLASEPRAPFLAAISENEWARVASLLSETRRMVADLANGASAVMSKPYVNQHSDEQRGPGRPDATARGWFVRNARNALEKVGDAAVRRRLKPGDWADLGYAVGIEDRAQDFEKVRKSYADLLGSDVTPGKRKRRTNSRAR